MNTDLERFHSLIADVLAEIQKVIIGQADAVRECLMVILANQHALIEGVPGLAKTLLARTLAAAIGCEFNRIQFTPDLMPADITGTNVFDLQRSEFKLLRGPVFTTFLLADEINRAPAKTQAALLQAMQERRVTIDRDTHELSPDFTVFATQNPIESEGTYPLPEAQKDRFMMKITMRWPEREHEVTLARLTLGTDAPEAVLQSGAVRQVLGPGELASLRGALAGVVTRDSVIDYAVDIVRRTRASDNIMTGAGPRATQSLVMAARIFAALDGRDFVTPDDVRSVAPPVLEHRLLLRPDFELEGVTVSEVIQEIVRDTPVPR
jgi:MoxR-like ATPase